MPRPRARQLFAIGKYWIAADPGSDNLYRFHTEPGTGRTRRASLGTADLREAEHRLAEIVVRGEPKTAASALSIVLENYFMARTDNLPSKEPARHAGRLLLKHFGPTAKVSVLHESGQRAFCEAMLKRGRALSYVARTMSVLNAAMRHADLREPRIVYSEAQMRERWAVKARARRRPYVPTDDDVARFFASGIPEAIRRWAVISCLTGCRPQAAVDLKVNARERAGRLLNLNPEGRAQNKKHRPTVREPRVLTAFLDAWERGCEISAPCAPPVFCGYSTMAGVDSALKRARRDLGLPRLSAYSFRHKVATVLRSAGVSEDQIALQLGHKRPDVRVTGGYGEWAPDYLREATAALDAWAVGILRKVRAVNSRRTPEGSAEEFRDAA